MTTCEGFTMKGEDISNRLQDLAVRMVKLVLALPKNQVGKHVGGQLLRCGTSAGANYEEARGGQRLADFVHKLAVSWKEIREACFWLKIVQRTQLVKPSRIDGLLSEAGELSAILGKSLTTAKNRAKKQFLIFHSPFSVPHFWQVARTMRNGERKTNNARGGG